MSGGGALKAAVLILLSIGQAACVVTDGDPAYYYHPPFPNVPAEVYNDEVTLFGRYVPPCPYVPVQSCYAGRYYQPAPRPIGVIYGY